MRYATLSMLSFTIFASLAVSLIAMPNVIYWFLHVPGSVEADFMSRRAAMLFFGLAVLTYMARGLAPSEGRIAISCGIGAAMAAVACLGLIEIIRGYAGYRLLLPVIVEIVVAASYARVVLSDRRA